ncbi:hypothetical protein O3P69_005836 [Scylla paramamosain]|uniref:Uncharacterized protein n=1 Tax=Scylla paramamosain TaxID=85552 RepID=A0AAW0U7A1_SCYPA
MKPLVEVTRVFKDMFVSTLLHTTSLSDPPRHQAGSAVSLVVLMFTNTGVAPSACTANLAQQIDPHHHGNQLIVNSRVVRSCRSEGSAGIP